MDGSSAQSIYRAEKARAMQERRMSHAQLMAEAKEAFAKMLADAQLARKGGRPRTNPVPPAPVAAAPPPSKPGQVATGDAGKPARQTTKSKAAPANKAASPKKVRIAAKRSAPSRSKPAKKTPKKAGRRVARPSARAKRKR